MQNIILLLRRKDSTLHFRNNLYGFILDEITSYYLSFINIIVKKIFIPIKTCDHLNFSKKIL